MPKWTGGSDGDDDDKGGQRGEKGRVSGAARRKSATNGTALEAKPDQMGGKDLASKKEADEAYKSFQADGNRPK